MLYRAIADGNWQRPLDLSLHSTHQGELQVPFARHVRQMNPTIPQANFQQYINLPAELQLEIFGFCDQATIFQLIHTSRQTRAEAKQLFFSSPETWYYVEAEWLLRGGYAAHTNRDLGFLACIERLNVDFGWMHERTWMNEDMSYEWVGTEEEAVATAYGGMDECIQNFWRTVKLRLPQLKHIILSDDHDRWDDSRDLHQPPAIYRKVGQMSPSGIDVYVFLVQGDGSLNRRMQRRLWRRVNSKGSPNTNETSEWKLCANHPGPNVIPPYKIFRGPVGLHDDSYARFSDIAHQRRAIRAHRIAAMERHHFYESSTPFGCSAPDCGAWFEKPEEYTSHVIETKHDKITKLPEFIESSFAENDERLERLTEIAGEIDRPFLEWWGKYGSEKRVVAEREYIAQLEHDPLYAQDKPVLEHPRLHAIHRSLDADY
jgi:hypothetical protein